MQAYYILLKHFKKGQSVVLNVTAKATSKTFWVEGQGQGTLTQGLKGFKEIAIIAQNMVIRPVNALKENKIQQKKYNHKKYKTQTA